MLLKCLANKMHINALISYILYNYSYENDYKWMVL